MDEDQKADCATDEEKESSNAAISDNQAEVASYNSNDAENISKIANNGGNQPVRSAFRLLERFSLSKWLTFLVGVGTLIVAVVSCKNAADTRDIKTAVAQLASLASETKRSADAASRQVETLQQDLRPIIYIKLTDPPKVGSDDIPRIRRRLANAGRGIALNLMRATKSNTFIVGQIPGEGILLPYPTDDDLDKSKVDSFIAPTSDAPADAISVAQDPLSIKQQTAVYYGSMIWAEWGVIRYEDVFGTRHHLLFCHTWDWKAPKVEDCPRTPKGD